MSTRYVVGKPIHEAEGTVYPVMDTEQGKRVRHGMTPQEAQRIAYHYNKVETWQK